MWPYISTLSKFPNPLRSSTDRGSETRMAKAKAVERSAGVEKRLVSVSVPIENVEPSVLLRLGKGGARGFWAREGRWFAHLGRAGGTQNFKDWINTTSGELLCEGYIPVNFFLPGIIHSSLIYQCLLII